MASQICDERKRHNIVSSYGTYSSSSTVEHCKLVKTPIFLYCIDILNDALGAIEACSNPRIVRSVVSLVG